MKIKISLAAVAVAASSFTIVRGTTFFDAGPRLPDHDPIVLTTIVKTKELIGEYVHSDGYIILQLKLLSSSKYVLVRHTDVGSVEEVAHGKWASDGRTLILDANTIEKRASFEIMDLDAEHCLVESPGMTIEGVVHRTVFVRMKPNGRL